jgi:uncharacterized protein (TIGR01777 family)
MRVFVTGGTGLVGTRLVRRLLGRGDTVVLLTRQPAEQVRARFAGAEVVQGDPTKAGQWQDAVTDCDGVIHLAGENTFARRWNDDFKKLLLDSRVEGTRNVAAGVVRRPVRADGSPKVLVSTSAIGFYGPTGDEELDENSPPGSDFLANVCVEWEKEAREAEKAGVRTALLRVGIVLDREGGALAKMLGPFRWCVGGKVGSGKQYMSWIHHEDMGGLFLHALDQAGVTGPLNGTAPNPVTNYAFTKALGRALHRPTVFPIPAFALRLRFGQVAGVMTTGQRVLPRRPLELGYQFKFPTIDEALTDVLGRRD